MSSTVQRTPRNPILHKDSGLAVRLEELSAPSVYRASTPKEQRRRMFRKESAAEAIGTLTPDLNLFGLTKGQFSLVDLLSAVLRQTGPARLSCSTWTAADASLAEVEEFLHSGLITDARFLVDFSFQRRQPGILNQMRQRFGSDCVRVTRNHSKFVLLKNEAWQLTLKTSMNLNQNPRLENFELSTDPGLFGFLEQLLNEMFSQKALESERARDHKNRFKEL